MSTIFWKNILKCLPAITPSSHPLPSELQQEYSDPLLPSSTTATPTSIMIKSFNSLYDLPSTSTSKSLSTPSSTNSSSSSYSDLDTDSLPDFTAIIASQRFFSSSPGSSNSIIEPMQVSHTPPVSGGVAIKKYSPDPYIDFKQSMQEMIEARELRDVRANWDCLHELLSCYLKLNPKHTHKFIISAFSDIIVCLLSSP